MQHLPPAKSGSTSPATATADPLQDLQRLINGFQVSQALFAVVELGIPDRLTGGSCTADELARALGVNAPALYRLLRALASIDVFCEGPDRSFVLRPIGELLRSDAKESRRAWARFAVSPPMWAAWSRLIDSVKTGETGFSREHGADVWAYRQAHPEDGARFDAAMRESSALLADNVLSAGRFERFRHVVDVGGGDGALIAAILQRHEEIRGCLLELPQVVERARGCLSRQGLGDRCTVTAGSFFDDVPPGGDAYVLKLVLHDWDDEDTRRILRACRIAMPSSAKLLVIERLLAPPNEGADCKLSDLNMLVNVGGKERTEAEYGDILNAEGLILADVRPLGRDLFILEAQPATN